MPVAAISQREEGTIEVVEIRGDQSDHPRTSRIDIREVAVEEAPAREQHSESAIVIVPELRLLDTENMVRLRKVKEIFMNKTSASPTSGLSGILRERVNIISTQIGKESRVTGHVGWPGGRKRRL